MDEPVQAPASTTACNSEQPDANVFFSPGCEHPECHNSTAMDYADGWHGNGPGAQPAMFIRWPSLRAKVGRRWCRSHALLNEGVAFG